MVSFRSPAKQANYVVRQFHGKEGATRSIGTIRNYEQSLTRVAEYLKSNKFGITLRQINKGIAERYLNDRAVDVGQKTLDMERQALQSMMVHVTKELLPDDKLEVVESSIPQKLESRSYTLDQVELICEHQTTRHSLSTKLAFESGLRAHELITINRIDQQSTHKRPVCDIKFEGREGIRYSVAGKGGLIREVMLTKATAKELEARRLPESIKVTDRGIHYEQHYNIAGGKPWTNAFSATSKRILGYSTGGHGLRHSYAQERMDELQGFAGAPFDDALEAVSQELGHFRKSITLVYLR